MKNVHVAIPDLFLPGEIAAEVCAGLELSALETLLARAQPERLPACTLEQWLCNAYGVADQAVAPATLLAEGMAPETFYWLRADPVHLRLRHGQMILQTDALMRPEEAEQLCASLNTHFSGTGLRFFAPHPQRWYLRLDKAPAMATHSLAQVAGKNVHAHLPAGADALHWIGVFNEIQMLFFEHAVNQAREARGELPVNSVWLWGGGYAGGKLAQPFGRMYGDSDLAAAFAQASGASCAAAPDSGRDWLEQGEGATLLVCEGLRRALQQGDLQAWRASLQRFEQTCAVPLLAALRAGHIVRVTLEAPGADAVRRFELTRVMAWKLWRRPQNLAHYAIM